MSQTYWRQVVLEVVPNTRRRSGWNPSWKSINLNIIGTANIVKICEKLKIKLIYFSSSYVYPGKKGKYKETDKYIPIVAIGFDDGYRKEVELDYVAQTGTFNEAIEMIDIKHHSEMVLADVLTIINSITC